MFPKTLFNSRGVPVRISPRFTSAPLTSVPSASATFKVVSAPLSSLIKSLKSSAAFSSNIPGSNALLYATNPLAAFASLLFKSKVPIDCRTGCPASFAVTLYNVLGFVSLSLKPAFFNANASAAVLSDTDC